MAVFRQDRWLGATMLSNAILSVVLIVVIVVNARHTNYSGKSTHPSRVVDDEYVHYLHGRIKALEAENQGLRKQFESGLRLVTSLSDQRCPPASSAERGGEGSTGFLDLSSWFDFLSSSAGYSLVWMLLGCVVYRVAVLLHDLFSGKGESILMCLDEQLDHKECLEPKERPSGRAREALSPRAPIAAGTSSTQGVSNPARRGAPSEAVLALAAPGVQAASVLADMAEEREEREEVLEAESPSPRAPCAAGATSRTGVSLPGKRAQSEWLPAQPGTLESVSAPSSLLLLAPLGLAPLDLGPPGLQPPARFPPADLIAQLHVGPPPGLPPPPPQSWDGLAVTRGIPLPSSQAEPHGPPPSQAADDPSGGRRVADESDLHLQPEATHSGESELEAEEVAAEARQKVAEPEVDDAVVAEVKVAQGGAASQPRLRSFAAAAQLARLGPAPACAGEAVAPASGEKEELCRDDCASQAHTSFSTEIASWLTYGFESEATARTDASRLESKATAEYISEEAEDDEEVYEVDSVEERGRFALSCVWWKVSESRGPQGEAQKRVRQAKAASRKRKQVEAKGGRRGAAAGAWRPPCAWSLPCSTWVFIVGAAMLALVLVGKVQNKASRTAMLTPPLWRFWRRKQAETGESCVLDPPKHIILLGENEEPQEPSGIKPRIVLRAHCLLKMYGKVAFKYRPTGVWYFKQDTSRRSLEVKHKNEAPHVMVKAATWNEGIIKTFLQDRIMPLVGPLTSVSYDWYIFDELGLIWVLFDVEGDGDIQASEQKHRPALMQLASEFKARYFTAFMDTSIVRNREWVAGEFGITEFPAVVVQDKAGVGTSAVYEGPIEVEALTEFLHDAEAGCFNYQHPLLTFDGHRRQKDGVCRFPEDALG